MLVLVLVSAVVGESHSAGSFQTRLQLLSDWLDVPRAVRLDIDGTVVCRCQNLPCYVLVRAQLSNGREYSFLVHRGQPLRREVIVFLGSSRGRHAVDKLFRLFPADRFWLIGL